MKLPVVSGREVINSEASVQVWRSCYRKALSKAGFYFVSQKGSHVKLRKSTPEKVFTVIVPAHDVVSKGTLRDIIRDAGLTVEQFCELL